MTLIPHFLNKSRYVCYYYIRKRHYEVFPIGFLEIGKNQIYSLYYFSCTLLCKIVCYRSLHYVFPFIIIHIPLSTFLGITIILLKLLLHNYSHFFHLILI